MQRHVNLIKAGFRCVTSSQSFILCPKRNLTPVAGKFISTYPGSCVFFRKMGNSESGLADTTSIPRPNKIILSKEEWKAKLSPEEYSVCRKEGTEPAFTGELLDNKDKGIYVCTCCGTDLFNSSTKFDSGSGWPSFFDVLKDKDVPDLPAVDTRTDTRIGMVRTEVLCGKCDAHLGHVFNDGPKPTGLRYCINSVCLKFKPDGAGKSKNKSEL